jgi:hypothetical protein
VTRNEKAASHGLWMHVGLVFGLTAVFLLLLALSNPEGGANIGAGLAGLPLLVLGLPWTIPIWSDPYQFDELSRGLRLTIYLGPACLNVAVHAVLHRLRARHRRSRASA